MTTATNIWAASADTRRPNILMILTDDQGWGDLSVSGNTNLSTPNVDSLAKDGVTFDRFYVCPVCSPTRAEILTGRYSVRVGVTGVSEGNERLDADEKTIAETFRAGGYATGAFGKWHNGMQWPYHPNARGFDEFYGFCSGHWGHYFSPDLEHNGTLVKGNGYVIDDFTERAMDFMDKNAAAGKPFFCYMPYNTPHSPMQMPDRFWKKFDGADLAMRHHDPEKENLEHTRAALAMCENIDWNVGRLLGKLDALGVADNTIVIYFSDNGPNGWRWNGGMKGRKGDTDEGGVRAPFFIRWPGKIDSGQTIPHIAGAIDLLPTLADLAGLPVVGNRKLDGVSLSPLLLGGAAARWPDRLYFSTWNQKVSVRSQKYRLDDPGRLFDMENDPGQWQDVAAQHPEVTATLRRAAADFRKDVVPPKTAARPFTVGHPGSLVTYLPARDGKPHGNVRRSAIHPNCSFFTNWSSPDDRITWDIEVLASGTYEAAVYCTCAAADVGAMLELEFGGKRVRGTLPEAFDPPLVGAAEDRVRREESYVKEFKPVTLGPLAMSRGRGELALRAVGIPGKRVADVRYVRLTRLESTGDNPQGTDLTEIRLDTKVSHEDATHRC